MICITHERDKMCAMNILDIAIEAESGVSNLARSIGVAPNVIGNWKKRRVPTAWAQLLAIKYLPKPVKTRKQPKVVANV